MYAIMYAMICVNIGLQAACANDVLPNAIPQFRKILTPNLLIKL